MVDYLFENKPKYPLIDEIDNMPAKDPDISIEPDGNWHINRNKAQENFNLPILDENLC